MSLKIVNTHTGKIFVDPLNQLEFLTVGDYGKENNIKADFLGLKKEIHGVQHHDVDLTKKWVATISTQKGCPMSCKFCDCPKYGYYGNATEDDLAYEIRTILEHFRDIKRTERFNVHFARMGEPTFNPSVLTFAELSLRQIVSMYIVADTIHPVVSTMMPATNRWLYPFLQEWCRIKNDIYKGEAGLQLSIQSTDEEQRKEQFDGKSLPLIRIADIAEHLPMPVGRKYTLNFAVTKDTILDAKELTRLFEHLKFPCIALRKYNGFLGLVSWHPQQQKLFIASKSTNDGDHSQLAESILRLYAPMEVIEAYLKENDCTMLFEICTKRDPHVIAEPEEPVLLDIVDNTINFHCKPYEEVRAFGEKHGIKYKQLDAVINNWQELEPMLDTMWVTDPGHPVEGWVIQAADGYNFKLKCRYYSVWKRLRTIKEFIERGVEKINEASFADGSWMKALYLFMDGLHRHGQLEGKSIIDVRDMWLADGGIDYPYKPETKEETNGSDE